MRSINCYDKKKAPKAETRERVFYLYTQLRKKPIPQLPLILEISAMKPPIQVVEESMETWRSLRHYQNLSDTGALSERFVSACAFQMLKALESIHQNNVVHCNVDPDHVMVFLTPFGGDHFRLVDFDNSRIAGSVVHPQY